jgi:DNA-binding transcriptional LysR family regulator
MDFKQIEYFIAIINSGNFSRAAENLYMSQPSLSKQIKALELELGVDLFNRKEKGCCLTIAGKKFLTFAQKVRGDKNDFINELGVCTKRTTSTIRIGALPIVTLPTYNFSSMIASFQALNLQYTIDYIEVDQHTLLHMLKDNSIELAIGRNGDENDKHFDILPLAIDEFIVVLHKDHPLSTKKVISLEEIAKDNFILVGHNSAIFNLCIKVFDSVNISPRVIHTNTRHKIVLEMVSKNLGITLLPKNMLDNNPNLKAIKLKEPFYSTVSLVRPKDKVYSPPSLVFWQYVKANYALN